MPVEMVMSVRTVSAVSEENGFSKKWPAPDMSPLAEPLPDEIPLLSLKTVQLPTCHMYGQNGKPVQKTKGSVLGKAVHGTGLEITEPEIDAELTGELEAYMASILAWYVETVVEKSKCHLAWYVRTFIYVPLF